MWIGYGIKADTFFSISGLTGRGFYALWYLKKKSAW